MESVKAWARGVFLVAVFSSTVMLLVPKSFIKQAKFVSEMLLLLCVIVPLAGLLRSGTAGPQRTSLPTAFTDFSLGQFYSMETAQRIAELAGKCGVETQEVSVTTKDGGFSLDRVLVAVMPGSPEDRLETFREAIGVYTGIPEDKVEILVSGP